MRKTYTLEELDCANCAAKMEAAIQKIPGVEKATVTFMTSRMSLVVADDADLAGILEQAQKAISRVDSACKIVVK